MSYSKSDHQRIHSLLDLYYQGDASRDDISEIKRYFAECEDVPSGLADEREIFALMADTDNIDTTAPADLEAKLLTIAKDERKPLLWRRLVPYAAAAALVCGIGYSAYRYIVAHQDDMSLDDTELVAETEVKTEPADTVMPEQPQPQIEQSLAQTAPATRGKKRQSTVKTQLTEAADPYIEITDPEEAARITHDMLCMISEKMNKAIDVTQEVSAKQQTEIKNILNKIQ